MEGSLRPLVRAATGSVFVLVALLVAARATRDTLFLSRFPVAALPAMIAGGALASIAVAIAATRGLTTLGPPRFVPRAFVAGAVVTLAAWGLALAAPSAGAVLFYLYAAALSPVLLAGFWSLLSERVDPRTARRTLGRIAAVGTLGGLAGGLLAERLAAGFGTLAILPALALAQGACAWGTARMGAVVPASAPADHARGDGLAPAPGSYRRLAATPYLRNLALLVFGGATGAAFLDFVFKAEVAGAAASEPALMRTFATFYSAVALLTLAFQALLARPLLERLGLARTMGLLPATVVVGGAAAALAPGPWAVGVLRGLEAVLRGSLHRGGYEILFTPIPPAEKRATRLLIDVGCERMGDLAGAALLGLVLALVPGSPAPVLLALAALLAAATLGVVLRVQRGYVASLEAGLRAGALRLDPALVADRTTWLTLHGTRSGTVSLGASGVAAAGGAGGAPGESAAPEPLPEVDTDDGVRAAIALLADDRRARRVHELLAPVAERHVERLVTALLDPATELGVRRRLPALLALAPGPRAADGLTRGLADPRFEVRYRCGRALARVLERGEGTWVDGDRVIAAARREAELDRTVWESQRLLDQLDEPVADTFVDDVLRDRAGRSLEHVFTLLSLVLDPEPLRIAFRGLLSGDRLQRGTALEYLDVVLPPSVHAVLWPHLEPERRPRVPGTPARDRSAVLADLLRSHASIEIDAAALRERIRPDG